MKNSLISCFPESSYRASWICKWHVALLSILLFAQSNACAQMDYEISYDMSDFSLIDSLGITSIRCNDALTRTAGDLTFPNLPYKPLRVLVPEDSDSVEYEVDFDKTLVKSGIRMEANPPSMTTNGEGSDGHPYAQSSVMKPVHDGGIISFSRYKYLYLKTTPFLFDSTTGNLFFVPRIRLHFPYMPKQSAACNAAGTDVKLDVGDALIKSMVVNPQDVSSQYPPREVTKYKPRMDYLVITNEKLINSFDSLLDWKKQKGLFSSSISTERIYNTFEGRDEQEKIKNCIIYYNSIYGTKYVMLGGDCTIVPARMYKIKTSDESGLTPADIYYSCKNIDFVAGRDSVLLKVKAKTSFFNPYVYLTRLPVRTEEEVANFTNKLLRYERDIPDTEATNKMLFAGYANEDSFNNATAISYTMYNHFVSPVWDGEVSYLCNKTSSQSEYNANPINSVALMNEIDRGYNIIHEYSHGWYDKWFLETDDYCDRHASFQKNTLPSVILTNACYTNAFDVKDCLSRAFITNKDGGAIAYFGSSREGYSKKVNNGLSSKKINESLLFDALFLDNLFREGPRICEYSFGAVATEAKRRMLEEMEDTEGKNHNLYLQLSINPIGDPEMQIHTGRIYDFEKNENNFETTIPNIYFSNNHDAVLVKNMPGGCRVVLVEENGEIRVGENSRSVKFTNIAKGKNQIGIFRHNFRPYIYKFKTVELIGGIVVTPICINISETGDKIKKISLVKVHDREYGLSDIDADELKEWNVEIVNVLTGENKVSQRVDNYALSIDTSGWKPGIYAVHASDGENITCKKLSVK